MAARGPPVIWFAVRRTLALVPILFGVAVVTFALLLLTPGSPADILLPPDTPQDAKRQFEAEYHLHDNVFVRFGAWLWHALQGEFGQSIASTGYSAWEVMSTGLVNTLQLVLGGAIIAVVIGVGLGIATAWWANSPFDRIAKVVIVAFVSMPGFWIGLVFVYFFALKLRWLPTSGMGPIEGGGDFGQTLRYMVLPAITVAILPAALISRLTRALFLEVTRQEFVLALRTRGYSTLRIWRHVLRNAAPGVLNITGLQLGYLVLGTLFVEVVFAWPGIGVVLQRSISFRDYPVIQLTILATGVLFSLITLTVDLLMRALDPRAEGA